MDTSNFAVSTMLNLARLKRFDGQVEQATNFINSFLDIQKNVLKEDTLYDIYVARSFVNGTYLHKYDEAIRDLDSVLEKKSYHSQALFRRFFMLQNHYKNYEEAIRDFDLLCTQEPSWNYGLVQWNFLVNSQTELSDVDTKKLWEEHVYNKQPAKNKDDLAVHLPYTEGYITENFFVENAPMLHALNEAIENKTKDDQVYCYRGWLYLHQFQNYSRALKDFIQAINLDPSYAFAYAWRGYCLLMMGNQNLALAKEDVRKAIQLDASFADSFYILSLMLIREEKYEAAWKSLQKFYELLPKRNPKLHEKYVQDAQFQVGLLKTKIDTSVLDPIQYVVRSPSAEVPSNIRNPLGSSKSKSETFAGNFRNISRTIDFPRPSKPKEDPPQLKVPEISETSQSTESDEPQKEEDATSTTSDDLTPSTPTTPSISLTPPSLIPAAPNLRLPKRFLSQGTRSSTMSALDKESTAPVSPPVVSKDTPPNLKLTRFNSASRIVELSTENSALNLQSSFNISSSNIRRKTPRVVSQFMRASLSPSSGNILAKPKKITKSKSSEAEDASSALEEEEENSVDNEKEKSGEPVPAKNDPLAEELKPSYMSKRTPSLPNLRVSRLRNLSLPPQDKSKEKQEEEKKEPEEPPQEEPTSNPPEEQPKDEPSKESEPVVSPPKVAPSKEMTPERELAIAIDFLRPVEKPADKEAPPKKDLLPFQNIVLKHVSHGPKQTSESKIATDQKSSEKPVETKSQPDSKSSTAVAAQPPQETTSQQQQKVMKFVKTPKAEPIIFTSADFNLKDWLSSIKMEFACDGLTNLGAETISDLHHLTPDDLDMVPELKHLQKKRLYSEIQKLVKADSSTDETDSESQNGNAGSQPDSLNPIFAADTKNDWWSFPSSVLTHSSWCEKGEVNTKYRTLCLCEDSQIYHNHLYQQIRFLLYKKFGFGRTWDFSKTKWKLKKIYAVHNDSMSTIHSSQLIKLARRMKEKPELFNKKDWKSAAKVKVANQIQGQLILEKAEKYINTFPQNENCIARVIPLLHAVSDLSQAWTVCESGFASRLDESGKHGAGNISRILSSVSGIYFSHQVGSVLHNFEKRNPAEKQQEYVFLVCHVLVGNVFPCTGPSSQIPGFDTHFAMVPRTDKEVQLEDLMKDTQSIFGEWVIFDEHQVLPQFIVVAEKE